MKNGDIANFRLSNPCSAGNGMLLQAMADQFGVQVTEYADVAFEAELAPKFSYGCAVFLDTDRVNFQKEGFSKEELLAGLAQVLPKNVWQYVVQIPRLAALGHEVRAPGRHAVQPRRASRRRSTTSRSAFPAPRSSSTRTPARPARSAPRSRRSASSSARARRPSSASMRRSTSSTRRERRGDASVTSARTSASAPSSTRRRPTGATAATSPASPARRAPSRARRRCSRSSPSARRWRSSSRTWSTTSRSRPSGTSTIRRRCPRRRHADQATSRSRRASSASTRRDPRGRSSARAPESLAGAPHGAHRHPARAQHLLDGAVLPDLLRDARHPEAERRLLRRDHRGDVGRGRQVRLDRSLLPVEGRAGAHPQPALPPPQPDEEDAQVHLLPASSRTCRASAKARWTTTSLPDRRRRARRHEGGLHQGGRLLRRARHRVRRSGAHLHRADAARAAACSRPGARASASPRTRATTPAARAGRRWTSFDADLQEKGRAILETVEAENRVAILMIGRPYHSDPGLNHGIPEEFQVLGYPILSMRSIPKDPEYLASLLQERHQGGADQDAARDERRLAGELLGQQRAEGLGREVRGAPPERGRARSVVASSAATTRRPTASSTRSSRRRRRPTRRCTTSTPTSRAARSRSASRPTPTALKLHEERLEDTAQAHATS